MNEPTTRVKDDDEKKKNARKGRRKTGKRTIEITQKRFARARTHTRAHTHSESIKYISHQSYKLFPLAPHLLSARRLSRFLPPRPRDCQNGALSLGAVWRHRTRALIHSVALQRGGSAAARGLLF